MKKGKISNNLLYSSKHFELLLKLYKSTFEEETNTDEIYNMITEAVVDGLNIDRCSFWKFDNEKLVCVDLFDKTSGTHSIEDDLHVNDLPIYFQALKDGIAIVADDALTNQYTKELKENYLIPLGITDMLDLPLRNEGELTSVLCCEQRDNPRKWSEVDLAFARSIGDILALMLEQKKRRDIEKSLLEQERKLSLITNNSNDAFIVFEDGEVTYISPSYLKILQYKESEVYHMKLEDIFKHIHPEDIERVKTTIYKNLDKLVKNFKYEFRFKGKAGKYFWREDTASVLYGEDGKYEKYIIISRDISAVKKAELKIEKLYAISKGLNERLLDFTHIISHNIRSSTSNITMLINLIDDADNDTERNEYFQLLKESNEKLNETIYYLNETVNIQLSAKEQRININLKATIEKVLSGINAIVKSNDTTIDYEIPENFKVNVIPHYFESVIFNLITNAIKYKSEKRKPLIIIRVEKNATKYTISVKDNGLGIDLAKNKTKIFGMYKTFHNNPEAIGLGLFMTKNHIEAMGGTIEVTSKVGVGSEFKVHLYEKL